MCALGQPLPSADDPYYPDIKDDPDADVDDVSSPHRGGGEGRGGALNPLLDTDHIHLWLVRLIQW